MRLHNQVEEEIAAFEAGELDPAAFPHREHVRLGYELLLRYRFAEAAVKMSAGVARLAAKAGHPESYHETITIAFLAAIAERMAGGTYTDWPKFIAANRELLARSYIERWYSKEELASSFARASFLLPQPRFREE